MSEPEAQAAKLVAEHYNIRGNEKRETRSESPIFHIRNFNNWIKAVLINNYLSEIRKTNRKPIVFDLACGKFGDIQKWSKAGVGYVIGADIATKSLYDALERWNDLRGFSKFPVKLISADCGEVDLVPHFGEGIAFDLVSCQFAFHYSFLSEPRARRFFSNACSKLRIGGYFIGTIPRACFLMKKAREGNSAEFGDQYYNVKFLEPELILNPESEIPPFGVTYEFSLTGAVEKCPEYLVHPKPLKLLGEEFGMELVKLESFYDYYKENISNPIYRDLWTKMRVPGLGDDWEASFVYDVFAFKKVRDGPTHNQFRVPPMKSRMSAEDVVMA